MRFLDNQQKEDITQDTYGQLAYHVAVGMESIRQKDAKELHNSLLCIYLFVWRRMEKTDAEDFEKKLDSTGKIIYSDKYHDPVQASRIFDTLLPLMKECTGLLDEMGILYGMKTDVNTIVAGGARR